MTTLTREDEDSDDGEFWRGRLSAEVKYQPTWYERVRAELRSLKKDFWEKSSSGTKTKYFKVEINPFAWSFLLYYPTGDGLNGYAIWTVNAADDRIKGLQWLQERLDKDRG